MTLHLSICPDKFARILQYSTEALAAARPDTALVLRRTLTSDGAGGFTENWATVTTVSARVSPQGMQPWEKMDRVEGRVIATSIWKIAMPAGTDVRPQDRINVTTLSRLYDVIATDGPQSFEDERTAQAVIVE